MIDMQAPLLLVMAPVWFNHRILLEKYWQYIKSNENGLYRVPDDKLTGTNGD